MGPSPLPSPPAEVCVLRLSALGDICHTLPVVRTLQARWPDARFTWILGRGEHALIGDIPEIDFVVFEKGKGLKPYRDLKRKLAGRRFDVLFHMQNSMRGNLASMQVKSPVRVGFARKLTKDHQWLFTNRKAPFRERAHVMDALFTFAEWAGAEERVLRWDIPVPEEARAKMAERFPDDRPLLVLSPCANPRMRNWRNWTPEGYAAVADYAAREHGLRVVLSGGPSEEERAMGDAILALTQTRPDDGIGTTSLKELLALLQRATALVCPDSGPAHMGTALGTPVIGLYATTNPDRARPYLSAEWLVNRYPEAAEAEFGVPVDQVPFGRRVRNPQAMSRVRVEDVTERLDAVLGAVRT